MEPIISRTTNEEMVRKGLVFLMFAGFALWFWRDGTSAYIVENIEKFTTKKMENPPKELPAANMNVREDAAEALVGKIETGGGVIRMEEVNEQFGAPQYSDGLTHWYFGPGGVLEIRELGTPSGGGLGTVAEATWHVGEHAETDLAVQKYLAGICGGVALIMLLHLMRVFTRRAYLGNEGVRINSGPMVPYDRMKKISAERFKKKGWVDIEYEEEDGEMDTLSLNDYYIKEFPTFMRVICEKTGMPNPLDKRAAGGAGHHPKAVH